MVNKMAKNNANEPGIKLKTLSTENDSASFFDGETFKAGALDEKGVDFTFKSMKSVHSKKFDKDFWVIDGEKDGKAIQILHSSAKLARLIDANLKPLTGAKVNLSGTGQKLTRNYFIKYLE